MAFIQLNLVRLLQILLITGFIETVLLGTCNAEEVAPPKEEPTLITGTLVQPVSLLERFQAVPIQTPPVGPRPSQYAEPKETLVQPVSILERFQEGPIQTPPEGPRPSQYAEPMVFPPIMGSRGKYPYVQMGGVFQITSIYYSQTKGNREVQQNDNNPTGNEPDGTGIRRARLTAFGSVAENVDYRFQFDLGGFGRPSITDVYMDILEVPYLGHVRIGHFKQPFSLEELTSFRFNPFLDRSSLFIFHPFRRTGIGFFDWSEDNKTTWFVSGFRGFNDFYGNDLTNTGGYGFAARGTHCLYYENEGKDLLHFGAIYSILAPSNGGIQFGRFGGNAPELGLIQGQFGTSNFTQNQSMVNTGSQLSRNLDPSIGPISEGTTYYQDFHIETALVRGPFSFQAEGDIVPVRMNNGNTPIFSGGYLFMTWFLTGEHRVYDRNLALFDRIIPNNNSRKGHPFGGAWELCTRLNYITLDSAGVKGGTLMDPTFGFNWYMNPFTKLSFNYIPAYLNSPQKYGDPTTPSVKTQANAWGLQAQVDF